jgi:hypothetical protein
MLEIAGCPSCGGFTRLQPIEGALIPTVCCGCRRRDQQWKRLAAASWCVAKAEQEEEDFELYPAGYCGA